MKALRRNFLMGLLLSIGLSGAGFAGAEIDCVDIDRDVQADQAGDKKPFEFKRGDGVLTIGSKISNEYRFTHNAVMLNNKLSEETGHFRLTTDTDINFAYGEKKYGYKAIEAATILRFKTIWGKIGGFTATQEAQGHSHDSGQPTVWMREAWIKASLNAMLGSEKNEKIQSIKVGMFPFSLGRGIALGIFYGVTKDFLAIYSRFAEFSAPGILLSGELVKDMLSYDVYYSKLDEKSASFGDVFNSNKEKLIGRRLTPWSGPAKDSDLVAARLKIKPMDDEKFGTIDVEPYIYYNEASDQKIEFTADAKSMLGAVGLNVEYKNKNFEIGGEVAVNYGHERVYAIDRNIVSTISEKYGPEVVVVQEESEHKVFSHITYADAIVLGFNGKNVVVNSASKSAVANNRNSQEGWEYNGQKWTPNPADTTVGVRYQNADNRYRPTYKNDYEGWMAVVDASYLIEDYGVKVSGAYGFASGDENPHKVECDKSYKGFVGLHELYSGGRVPSVFILDARKVKRPLLFDEKDAEAGAANDPSFTDIHYFGFGVTWEPTCCKDKNLSINPNILFFGKDHESKKYDCVNNKISECKASKFLGTEFNLLAKYDLLKDLTLMGAFAFFVSGSYYDDIKGAPMDGDLFNKLEETDKAQLDSAKYRIGNDNAIYAQVKLEYIF